MAATFSFFHVLLLSVKRPLASSTTLEAHRLQGDQHALCWFFHCPYQALLISPCRLHIRVHATNLFLGYRLESFNLMRDRGTEASRSYPEI